MMKKLMARILLVLIVMLAMAPLSAFAEENITISGTISLPEGFVLEKTIGITVFAEYGDHPKSEFEMKPGEESIPYSFTFPNPNQEYFISFRVNNHSSEHDDNAKGIDGLVYYVNFGGDGATTNFGAALNPDQTNIQNADIVLFEAATLKGSLTVPAPLTDSNEDSIQVFALNRDYKVIGWGFANVEGGKTTTEFVLRPLKNEEYTIRVNVRDPQGYQLSQEEYYYAGDAGTVTSFEDAVFIKNDGNVKLIVGNEVKGATGVVVASALAVTAVAGATAVATKTAGSAAYSEYKTLLKKGIKQSPAMLILNFLLDNHKIWIIGVEDDGSQILRKMKMKVQDQNKICVDLTEDFDYSDHGVIKVRYPKKITIKGESLSMDYLYCDTLIAQETFPKGSKLISHSKIINKS